MNNTYDREIVFSKNVIEMLTVANEYCYFIEHAEKYPTDYLFEFLTKIAPLLYLKAILLPEVEVADDWANEKYLTEEDYLGIHNKLSEKLKGQNTYADSDHVSPFDSGIQKYELSEQLSDIYQDLKDFVWLYQKESLASKENAVHDCKLLFASRWGYKILSVLKMSHHIVWADKNI